HILHQRGKAYLTVRQLVASLRTRVRQQLGLTKSQATAELLKKMTPRLGESLQVYRGSRSVYIGQKHSPAEIILQRVQQSPGISPKQLGLGLPLSKHSSIATLNTLLEAIRKPTSNVIPLSSSILAVMKGRTIAWGKPMKHKINITDLDHRRTRFHTALIVLTVAPIPPIPGVRTLNDPAFLQWREAF